MSELPTGTVTFLFTDIEGSTRLLRALGPSAYRAAQDRHGVILRRAIAAGGGTEIRTEGDSFFAVFPTAPGALRAAVTAQRELTAESWSDGTAIRVRMGLHSGEGRRGGDDYVGIDVNRAARIAAAGHGGQILLSDATRALVEQALPEGTTIRRLGMHRLKDIAEPERLHDLVVDGLPADFPPIRSVAVTPTNLPPERTSFVGRGADVARILELSAETRLLTVTGPGGTGKSRLALKVGERRLDHFPDGVFLVSLSSVIDPTLVPSAISSALGVREDPSRPLMDAVVDELRERRTLLVLDNFEQIVEAASVVDRLLVDAPRVEVLATSRVPLRISGEQEYRLGPLALPNPDQTNDLDALRGSEAVALFVDRTVAVRPDFRLTEENALAVAAITARLDGLPLAIELATSRARVLSPTELLERLDPRLPLLSGGSRDVPERQRTLRSTMEWSHDLLPPPEQRLFARLAAFVGGWTLVAAEAVCGHGLEIDVLDGLETLVEHSLVRADRQPNGDTRFRMLETIGEFAAERLARGGEETEIRRRHTWHVDEMAESAEPDLLHGDRAWLDRLEAELDNIRRAIRWSIESGEAEPGLRIAGALWRFWQFRDHLAEGRGWTEQLLSLPAANDPTTPRARALGALGSLAYYLADWEAARAPYEESLAIAQAVGDEEAESQAAFNLSFIPLLAGDFRSAKDLLLRAREIEISRGDHVHLAHVNTALALAMFRGGDLDGAKGLLQEALPTFVAAGDQWGVMFAAGQLGGIALRRGDIGLARSLMVQSLDAAEASGARGPAAVALRGLAGLYIRAGDLERGVRLEGAALRLFEVSRSGEPPSPLTGLDDPVLLLEGRLPQHRIDALLSEGRDLDHEDAIALARGA
jgi:predicted ATPase/class 3 adenylate cyclase